MKKWLLSKSWHLALFITAVWTILTLGTFYLTGKATTLLPFLLWLLLIYPVTTVASAFIFSKNSAKILPTAVPMIIISAFEYFVLGFDEIGSPNYLILTSVMVLLGSFIGRAFSKVSYLTFSDRIKLKKQKKEQAEKEYKSIIQK